MYCIVSTFSKTFDELGLIYFIPSFLKDKLKIGNFVEIPMGNKTELAIILKIGELKELNIENIPEDKIKSLISIQNNTQFLNNKQIELIFFISKYCFTPIHNALNLFFPKNLKEKIKNNKINNPLTPLSGEIKCSSYPNKGNGGVLKYNFIFDKSLSTKQEDTFNKINNSKEKKFLLHGVTGSGKTEIYIKLIQEQLKVEKQSLLLIPEIILTNQHETRLKKVFGENVLVINSSITEVKKTKAWISIYQNQAKIILGTRSALFYPYQDLGLIIIDEEHDNSYISDQAPRYNSIEIANKITDIYGNKLLLASGTPSIKSMYQAVKGKYKLLKLLEKFDK